MDKTKKLLPLSTVAVLMSLWTAAYGAGVTETWRKIWAYKLGKGSLCIILILIVTEDH